MEKEEDKELERIAKIIDPGGTFLDECERIVEQRFGKEELKEVQNR